MNNNARLRTGWLSPHLKGFVWVLTLSCFLFLFEERGKKRRWSKKHWFIIQFWILSCTKKRRERGLKEREERKKLRKKKEDFLQLLQKSLFLAWFVASSFSPAAPFQTLKISFPPPFSSSFLQLLQFLCCSQLVICTRVFWRTRPSQKPTFVSLSLFPFPLI